MQLQKIQEDLETLQKMYDAKMKEKEDLIKMARGMLSLSLFPSSSLSPSLYTYLFIHPSIYLSILLLLIKQEMETEISLPFYLINFISYETFKFHTGYLSY